MYLNFGLLRLACSTRFYQLNLEIKKNIALFVLGERQTI